THVVRHGRGRSSVLCGTARCWLWRSAHPSPPPATESVEVSPLNPRGEGGLLLGYLDLPRFPMQFRRDSGSRKMVVGGVVVQSNLAVRQCFAHDVRSVAGAQLVANVFDVMLNRSGAEVGLLRHLLRR